MQGDWFYKKDYGIFGHEVKATGKSPPDNLKRWIINHLVQRLYKKVYWKDKQIREGTHLFSPYFSDPDKIKYNGNSAPAMDAQQVFNGTFKALINEHYSIGIDIDRNHGVLEHALSKVDFSVGTGIYMLPSDLNLSMGKTKGYNNKILVSNTDMKIGSTKHINKDHKKLPVTPPDDDMPKIVIPVVRHNNPKMLTEKHNDEKLVITLLIVGTGLIAYHFW